MSFNIDISLNRVEKQVWLWKFIFAISSILVFAILCSIINKINYSAISTFFAIIGLTYVVYSKYGLFKRTIGSTIIVTIVVIVMFLNFLFYLDTSSGLVVIILAATITCFTTSISISHHEISLSSNLVSTVFQFLITWCGFYISQNISIIIR